MAKNFRAPDGPDEPANPGEPVRIPVEGVLDLHAFAPPDITSVVDEYLRAAHEAGLTEVRFIHGRGKGVQRGIVQQALERHHLVLEFWDAAESHLGATVARLHPARGSAPDPGSVARGDR